MPKFVPVHLESSYNRNIQHLQPGDCSKTVVNNKQHLLTGQHTLWGIPFILGPDKEGHNVIIVKDQDVDISLAEPVHDRQLIFVHAADFKESDVSADGITSPMMGTPRLGETVCEYILHYADGTQYCMPIRRRYQISEFQVKWGENSFEAVKHIKPRTMPTNTDLLHKAAPIIPWGQSQLRTTFQGFGSVMHHWLYALNNPYPDKKLVQLTARPVDGVAFIFGLTRTDLETNPLRWEARKKLRYTAKSDMELNPFGDNPNIRLDLGEVISVAPVLEYHHDQWLEHPHPSMPAAKPKEWIIEYSAHPAAELTIEETDGSIITLEPNNLEASPQFNKLPDTNHKVKLRIVDQKSGSSIAAKIHVHGLFGEYIAPVNGHRLPNAHWFEDYGVEHVQGAHYSVYIDGEAEFKLPLGEVYIEVSKGFEIRPVRKKFIISENINEITIKLEHVLPWRNKGWVTADTHVHFLSPQTALLEGEAEGVNVVNLLTSQWGEMFSNLGDFDGKTTIGSRENGGSGEYLVRVGTENRQHVLGHISLLGYEGRMILPLCTAGPDESAIGDPLESTLSQWAKQCREQNGLVVMPHLPNPRGEGAAAIVLGEVDAIEMCSFENKGINPYSLSDWYRYLNCGFMMPAVGGTDKMSQITAVGTIRTYAFIDKNHLFTYQSWMDTVRRGHTFATFGPLLEFHVNGHQMGSQMNMKASGGTVDVVWEVASVTIPVTKIELVINGELREMKSVDPQTGNYSGHWSVPIKESCWLALRIRGLDSDQTEMIAAHSSAVAVKVEGKSSFNSIDAVTILEQIEGATAYVKSLGTKADDRTFKQVLMTLTSAHRALHNRMHQHGIMHHHTVVDDHAEHHRHSGHQGHSHGHSRSHSHTHDHGHNHSHTHDHSHNHSHTREHGHKHHHKHE